MTSSVKNQFKGSEKSAIFPTILGSFFVMRKNKFRTHMKKLRNHSFRSFFVEAPPRFELGVKVLQTSALPLGYGAMWSGRRDSNSRHPPWQGGTLPLSYYRTWCLGAESNHRHVDFQSTALPTELPRLVATRKGLEPSTSSVTGWHSNQLNYRARYWWEQLGSNQ